MNGIELYPVGNFIFIPLSIMAYGILEHRLMDMRTILHITFVWGLVSSLAVVINIGVFFFLRDVLKNATNLEMFSILAGWFVVNFWYFSRVQPRIDRIFNKHKIDLKKAETEMIGNILRLKTFHEFHDELTNRIRESLYFSRARLYMKDEGDGCFHFEDGGSVCNDAAISASLKTVSLIYRDQVATDPAHAGQREVLGRLFETLDCEYIVPLVRNDELIGILVLSDRKNLKQLRKEEVSFLEHITSAVLISLANSKMYQDLKTMKENLEEIVRSRTAELSTAMEKMEEANREIRSTRNELEVERDVLKSKNKVMEDELLLARKIQEQFIPGESPSKHIHAIYKPMHQVGGDYYDFLNFRNPDTTGIFVSDVSGHGVPAALITSMIKTMILQSGKFRKDPAALLTWLNENLYSHTGWNFITALYCIFDKTTREIVYANAGHNPPCIIHQGKTSMLPLERSLPLAILDNDSLKQRGRAYCNTTAVLPPHSRLVMYTDGLTECMHYDQGQEMFEETLLKNNFYDAPGVSVNDFFEGIHRELVRFRGCDTFDDDICIICVDVG